MPRTLRDARTIEGDVQAGADANFPASGLVSLAAIRSMASRASGLRSRGRCQPRRERPRRCRNANKSDEFAPLHPHLTGEQRTSAPKERSTLPANGANRARSTPATSIARRCASSTGSRRPAFTAGRGPRRQDAGRPREAAAAGARRTPAPPRARRGRPRRATPPHARKRRLVVGVLDCHLSPLETIAARPRFWEAGAFSQPIALGFSLATSAAQAFLATLVVDAVKTSRASMDCRVGTEGH
jgi:hypothetical protein